MQHVSHPMPSMLLNERALRLQIHGGTSIKITQVHVHGQAMKQRAYQKIVAAYVEINSAEAAHRLDLSRGYEAAQDIVRAQDRVSEVDDLEMLSCVWEALRFLSGVGEVNFAPHRDHNEATARADRASAMFKDVAVRKSRRYVQKKWKEADERERKVAEQSKQLRRATSLVCAITGVGLLGTFIYFATAIPNEPR
jgi:hypothetical protein